MKRVKYLNNRDLLAQIHASKNTYCSYVNKEDSQYDIIVPNLKKINANAIAQARKARAKRMTQEAWEAAKAAGEKKIKLVDLRLTEAIFEKDDKTYMMIDFNNLIREADEY